MGERSGLAEHLADVLAERGVTVGFGVPGGGANLDLIGALDAAGIGFALAHGETAACIMASVHGLLTGTPTPAVVTRGPGAAAAVNGAAQATLDRHPLVLVTDSVPTGARHRVPHQRIDQAALLSPVTKASAAVGDRTDPAVLRRLLRLATDQPMGAVHLDHDTGLDGDIGLDDHGGPDTGAGPDQTLSPRDRTALELAAAMVRSARRPVVIVGVGAVHRADAVARALEHFGAPVLTTYQAAGVLPSEHPLSAGLFTNGATEATLLDRADVIVAVGLDPVEPRSAPWPYQQPVVSLTSAPSTDRYHPTAVEAIGPIEKLVGHVLELDDGRSEWPHDAGARHRAAVRDDLRRGEPDGLGPVRLVETLAASSPADAIVTVDAGAHFLAVMPFWPASRPTSVLISNGLATMGYALPAAIGAALARPDSPTLCLTGDGGLGMVLSELETVVRLDLPITTVVFNDSGLSLIEIKQRATGHGGSDAVTYRTTDFAAAARSMGMSAQVASNVDDVEAALRDGWQRPRLIDARIDPSHYRHLIAVTRG